MSRESQAHEADHGQGDPGLYEYAFLAGGGRRVVECALVALIERGTLSMRAARVRTVRAEQPAHPIELALVAVCSRSRSVKDVVEVLMDCPEMDELAHRLVLDGLLHRRRRRPTRAGRRLLAAATSSRSGIPAYVLEGPTELARGPVQYGLLSAQPIPEGLGRRLLRLGRALDNSDSDATTDAGSAHSCGSGSGGGGD
ncbi:TIGR04222 domain-containing membrane protein [Streptomyces sp. NPDC048560]|uniref:TIGR04222 domain-containing membrane protein n=1 Tax=Streptomyces sp. NPDC048560 TaxID=3155488 RepID=UPI003448F2D1